MTKVIHTAGVIEHDLLIEQAPSGLAQPNVESLVPGLAEP
jgi:hypothetical protein